MTYQHGRIRELGTLGGNEGFTKAINTHGVVVGSAQTAGGAWHAFRYDAAGGMRDLGTLGGTSSYATAITRDGMIAGYADTSAGDFHAFVTKADHSLQDLGTLGGASSYASGLNTHGVVVGTAQRSDGYRRAFVYRPGAGMQEIGTLPGGRISSATAINDAGLVVGAIYTGHKFQAFAVSSRAAPPPQRGNPLDWLVITFVIGASGVVLYKLQRNYRMGLLGARTRFM